MKHDGVPSGGPYAIRSVERVVDILDLLAAAPAGVSLSHVADVTGLPRSSAFRYLATLEARGYVRKNPDTARYRLGPGFPPLRARLMDLLTAAAEPHLQQIRDRFGETTNLGVLEGDRVTYALILESPRQVRLAARVGDHDPIHCTALGKAIATRLPRHRVEDILQREGLVARTPRTVTTADVLFAALDAVARDGYAVDDRENEMDGRCVAVALPIPELHAAVSVSAPSSRLAVDTVPDVAEALGAVTAQIAREFAERHEHAAVAVDG